MSFKDDARLEILSALPKSDCCKRAFLSAVARVAGSVEIASKRLNLTIWFEDRERGLAILSLFKSIYPTEFELSCESKKQGVKLTVPVGFTKQALLDFELMSGDESGLTGFVEGVPQELLRKECCKLAYFKGLFLTCGGVYVPDGAKSGYHFELQLDDDELFAEDVMELLSDLRINTKLNERGEHRLLYVKDKDEILDILVKLGLTESALKLKGIIDDRESANDINRAIICETANFDKVVTASAKTILAVAKLKDADKFDSLPTALKEAADIRAQYPEATLNELAEKLGVTKSCLNHRLRRLAELAEETE